MSLYKWNILNNSSGIMVKHKNNENFKVINGHKNLLYIAIGKIICRHVI